VRLQIRAGFCGPSSKWFAVFNLAPRDAPRRTRAWQRLTEEGRLFHSVPEAVSRYRARN